MALWWCNPPPSGRTVISERGVRLFSEEVWIMFSGLGYQFRASHFPCLTRCSHRTGSQAQQHLYRAELFYRENVPQQHTTSISSPSPAPLWSTRQQMTSSHTALASFCCREAGSLSAQQKCSFPETQPCQQAFIPWPGIGELLWEVERSSQIHQGQQSVGNRGEGTDCEREEFNGKPRSACTWPSALL